MYFLDLSWFFVSFSAFGKIIKQQRTLHCSNQRASPVSNPEKGAKWINSFLIIPSKKDIDASMLHILPKSFYGNYQTCFCQRVRLSCFGELPDIVKKCQKKRKWPILGVTRLDFTKQTNLHYFSVSFGFFEQFLAKPHLVARQNWTI